MCTRFWYKMSNIESALCTNQFRLLPSPPGPTPGDLWVFFRGTTNSPPPSCQKLQIPRPWATEKQQKLQKLKKHILKARLIT